MTSGGTNWKMQQYTIIILEAGCNRDSPHSASNCATNCDSFAASAGSTDPTHGANAGGAKNGLVQTAFPKTAGWVTASAHVIHVVSDVVWLAF